MICLNNWLLNWPLYCHVLPVWKNRAYWICVLLRGFPSLCQKTQSWKTHSQITQGWKTQGQTKYNHVSSRGSQIELRLNSDWTRRNCRSPGGTTHSCTPIAPRSNDKVPLGTRRTPHQAHQNIALRANRNHTRSHAYPWFASSRECRSIIWDPQTVWTTIRLTWFHNVEAGFTFPRLVWKV